LSRTKIICTIGPAVAGYDTIVSLIEAGMNVARLNFSHGTHEEHALVIERLKKARDALGVPVAIMLDTKGPELRLGKISGGETFLKEGAQVKLVAHEVLGDQNQISLRPKEILPHLRPGDLVLLDEGYIVAKVIETSPVYALIEIERGGLIKSGKGVTIPKVSFSLPAVTDKDVEDIRFGCLQDVDMIAASFVRSASHVVQIKELLKENQKEDILVIAKIENEEGIKHLDSIVQVADGIMIARGDLGVEVPLEKVPGLQKLMIRKAYLVGKPSVTATQMLESMIYNVRPTRAEASDVANAIYDGTSAVMLSGETAVGKYPVETVKTMKRIIIEAESDIDYKEFFLEHGAHTTHDIPSAVTLAAVKTAFGSQAKAIFAFTQLGHSARLISRLRPSMPIVAMTPSKKCFHQMALNWGVYPIFDPLCRSMEEAYEHLSARCLELGIVQNGDLVVLSLCAPFAVSGATNTMLVKSIGDVLLRGLKGVGPKISGDLLFLLSPQDKTIEEVRGKIVLITKCDESYLPFLKVSLGFVLQNHVNDKESEVYALLIGKELGISVVVRADSALRLMREGDKISLDPERALIFRFLTKD
jgi:pyruvate kinase